MMSAPTPQVMAAPEQPRPVLPPQGTKPGKKNPTPTFLGTPTANESMQGGGTGKTLLGQ